LVNVVEDSTGVDVTNAEEGTDFSKALRSPAEARASGLRHVHPGTAV